MAAGRPLGPPPIDAPRRGPALPEQRRTRFSQVGHLGRRLAVVAVGAVILFLLTPTGRYLLRAGWEELKILRRRQPIEALVASPATDPGVRAKLRLVLAARAFAADSIGLRVRQSFTTYSPLDHDTLVLVVSGAYRDRLKPYTWWFPIVGRVPYKGYFDFAQARAAARDLERRGFDAHVRAAAAFSTLGWLNDPLVSATLRADSLALANTVIHEVTHNTLYAPGQAVFNESFANFVGARGAAWLFRSRGSAAAAEEVEARWSDEKLLGAFWTGVYRELDSAFKSHRENDLAGRLHARDTIFARARRRLVFDVGPRLRTISPRYAERVPLDNAVVLAQRVYRTDLQLFDDVWAREGQNLPRTVRRLITLAKSKPKAPFEAMRAWLGAPPVDTLPEHDGPLTTAGRFGIRGGPPRLVRRVGTDRPS